VQPAQILAVVPELISAIYAMAGDPEATIQLFYDMFAEGKVEELLKVCCTGATGVLSGYIVVDMVLVARHHAILTAPFTCTSPA
jgi:hypothetical protein